ncbi:MAG: leucyl/phenylalanyl-tRNA--protein transferase [Desulfobacteraceae bacterium]|nr:leucyl/phenylalanyl-tRNA--protein transferase [Desulfobacteraceae bacterium]
MPVYRLTDRLVFPHPSLADPGGLLAVGGDLSAGRLLLAYANGIFPWYSEPSPILWWSPDPRLVLFPDELRVSHSLRRVLRKGVFSVTVDAAFEQVIDACAFVRTSRGGETWITPEMIDAYVQLHRLGYAHSVESWRDGELAGGLYGIALGRAFFGESMFMRVTDASKVAFVHLVELAQERGFCFIDCQTTTSHLQNFGAREIPRSEFLIRLSLALQGELRLPFTPSS